jgi:uncharacterized protein YcaQ
MAEHTTPYPLSAVRALALYAQGLTEKPPAPTRETIYAAVDRIGCVQIDTLQLVHRSQYLALWSRLGRYDPDDLDHVAYGDGTDGTRRLFEYWLKEACLIPLTEYRYRLRMMRWYREGNHRWGSTWLNQPGSREITAAVLERIRREGGLRSADFEHMGERPSSWWGWKPAKRALEVLYNQGELMIARREKFQRVYDLRERVLPEWVDATEPTEDETTRHLLMRAARALGICAPLQAADYFRVKRTEAKPHLERLIAEGALVPVKATLADGKTHSLVTPREHIPLLQRAAEGALTATRTTFLTPFDNLLWARGRDKQLWGFTQVLEAYKPEPQRIWGYFCLPILHRDRLVGRFDPKLERKTGLLRLKALYLEPDTAPDAELAADVASAMRDFMAFHGARDLVVERSTPAAFGTKLLKAL